MNRSRAWVWTWASLGGSFAAAVVALMLTRISYGEALPLAFLAISGVLSIIGIGLGVVAIGENPWKATLGVLGNVIVLLLLIASFTTTRVLF